MLSADIAGEFGAAGETTGESGAKGGVAWYRDGDCTREQEGAGESGGDDAIACGSCDSDYTREREEPGVGQSPP